MQSAVSSTMAPSPHAQKNISPLVLIDKKTDSVLRPSPLVLTEKKSDSVLGPSPLVLNEKKRDSVLCPSLLTVNKKPHDKKYIRAHVIATVPGYSNSKQELEKLSDYDPASPTSEDILNAHLTPSTQCKKSFVRCTSVRYKRKLFNDVNGTPRKRAFINLDKQQKNETLTDKSKNKNQVTLSEDTQQIIDLLRRALDRATSLKKTDNKILPGFKGLALTIRSLLFLYEELKTEERMSKHICQDSLKNFFSLVRSKGGFNRKTSVCDFRLSFRQLLAAKLHNIISPAGNCHNENECDDTQARHELPSNKVNNFDERVLAWPLEDTSAESSVVLEMCAKKYTAGFVIRKCVHQFRCSDCKSELLGDAYNFSGDQDNTFTENKKYLSTFKLVQPSKLANNIISKCFCLSAKSFQLNKSSTNICQNICREVTSDIRDSYPNFLSNCPQHLEFLLKYAVLLQITKCVAWESQSIRHQA